MWLDSFAVQLDRAVSVLHVEGAGSTGSLLLSLGSFGKSCTKQKRTIYNAKKDED